MAEAKAATQKSTGTGKLRSVNIRALENGYLGSCSYEEKPGKNGYPSYERDKEYALKDRAAIHEFIDEALGMGEKKKGKKDDDEQWDDKLNKMRPR